MWPQQASGQVGASKMSKYMVKKMGEEMEWFAHCEERRNWKDEGGEEWPDVSSLHCHLRLW